MNVFSSLESGAGFTLKVTEVRLSAAAYQQLISRNKLTKFSSDGGSLRIIVKTSIYV